MSKFEQQESNALPQDLLLVELSSGRDTSDSLTAIAHQGREFLMRKVCWYVCVRSKNNANYSPCQAHPELIPTIMRGGSTYHLRIATPPFLYCDIC